MVVVGALRVERCADDAKHGHLGRSRGRIRGSDTGRAKVRVRVRGAEDVKGGLG